jgi:hydroxyacylglutathione hydrolase
MPLEDHAGDVIRKSRIGLGISSSEVAAAGQIDEDSLSKFEEHGTPSNGIHFGNIASLLTLDGGKLSAVASGWEPQQQDVSRWHHLRHIETDDGGMAVNCFLIWDQNTREAALFDTGWILRPIEEHIKQHELNLRHIFITHSHYDHIEALGDVRKMTPEAAIHSNILASPKIQRLLPQESFQLGGLTIQYRETPGHADDGVTYVVDGFPEKSSPIAIVGDAIFAGSIGGARSHFQLARDKIQEAIFSLPGDTLICPGHGPVTTVAEELAHNPFFS